MKKNDIILRGILVDNNESNAIWNYSHKPVPLTLNFDQEKKIGEAKLYEEEGKIVADLTIKHGSELKGWPAIAGIVREREGDVITKFDITSVGICSMPNQDESIEKISEQIKK